MDANTPVALKRSIRLVDLVMLGAGTAMGASIFSVLGPATALGGSSILIAIVLAALPMVVFGINYAFMASTHPVTGASYTWQSAYVHPLVAFLITWLRVFGNMALLVVMAQVLVNYLGMAVSLPAKPTMFVAMTLVFALNYFGVKIAARAQTVLMLLLLSLFTVLVVFGIGPATSANIGNIFAGGWKPVLAAIPILVPLFLGIETISEVGDEVKNASVTIPVALVLALSLAMAVYLSIAAVSLGLIGPKALGESQAPLLDAGKVALGSYALPLIVTAATLALLKSLNAICMIFSRNLYAMGKGGSLPAPLARVHPRFGTPHIAVLTVAVLGWLGLFLPSNLVFLFLAVSIPTMGNYFGTCLAANNVARRHPAIYERAKIKLSRPWLKAISLLGMLGAVFIALLGLTSDWRPFALIAAWACIGLLYYFLVRPRLVRAPR